MEVADRRNGAETFAATRRQPVERGTIKSTTLSRIKIAAFAGLIGYLIGFVPLWLTSAGYQKELDSMVKVLRPSVLQNDLATATISARRGEFEDARQQASGFFTDLRAELDRDESSFATPQREAVRSILEQRDETITLLARKDPASADFLTELYFKYLKVKNSSVPESK